MKNKHQESLSRSIRKHGHAGLPLPADRCRTYATYKEWDGNHVYAWCISRCVCLSFYRRRVGTRPLSRSSPWTRARPTPPCGTCRRHTTGDAGFPECQMHSGKTQKHSGKPSPSATLGEEPPGMPLTGKSSSPSAKNRTLGEDFPECRYSTRGRVNAVGAVRLFFLKILFPECNTRGRVLFFLKKTLPRVLHSGKKIFF
jgi:hypothetical protein